MCLALPQGKNPRWSLCAYALGLSPYGEDEAALVPLVFIVWNSRRWADFARAHGCKNPEDVQHKMYGEGRDPQAEYDAWLYAGVEAGKWREHPTWRGRE